MANDSAEAELIRVPGGITAEVLLAALRGNGIDARARGEIIGAVYGLTLDGLGEMTILVPVSQLERARAVLEAGEHGALFARDGEESR